MTISSGSQRKPASCVMRSETRIGALRIPSEKNSENIHVSIERNMEGVIEIVSFTLRCIKNAILILGPLREDLRAFNSGKMMEKRIAESSEMIHYVFFSGS